MRGLGVREANGGAGRINPKYRVGLLIRGSGCDKEIEKLMRTHLAILVRRSIESMRMVPVAVTWMSRHFNPADSTSRL